MTDRDRRKPPRKRQAGHARLEPTAIDDSEQKRLEQDPWRPASPMPAGYAPAGHILILMGLYDNYTNLNY